MKRTELKRTPFRRKPAKPRSRAVKLAHKRKAAKNKVVKENDQILRALALMRDGRCVVPDCEHPMNKLEVSHIYPKGEAQFPHMRWILENVEIRCVGHHKFLPGSPHNDAGGWGIWVMQLPRKRMNLLKREAARRGLVKVDRAFIDQWNVDLRAAYLRATGSAWGE